MLGLHAPGVPLCLPQLWPPWDETGPPGSLASLPSPVAHHDLDNTLNCSFLEPPSGLEQPSPSWSSRASFSSFDTTDEGPVYCVPHEGECGSAWIWCQIFRERSLYLGEGQAAWGGSGWMWLWKQGAVQLCPGVCVGEMCDSPLARYGPASPLRLGELWGTSRSASQTQDSRTNLQFWPLFLYLPPSQNLKDGL